jgi:hypothetical protein
LIVNQSTLGLGLVDAAALHAIAPSTVYIDLSTANQHASKSGVLLLGAKSFGSIKWQPRFWYIPERVFVYYSIFSPTHAPTRSCIVGSYLVIYNQKGDAEPLLALSLAGKKPVSIVVSVCFKRFFNSQFLHTHIGNRFRIAFFEIRLESSIFCEIGWQNKTVSSAGRGRQCCVVVDGLVAPRRRTLAELARTTLLKIKYSI